MPRPLVALAILADSAGALLMTRRTPASRRRPQLRARADADEAEELRRIFESGADLLTPEDEMANEDAREGVASVFDAEDMRTLFHEGLAAEGDAPPTLAKSAGSLADMDDASFKLLMWKRLGQNDFDRIFKGRGIRITAGDFSRAVSSRRRQACDVHEPDLCRINKWLTLSPPSTRVAWEYPYRYQCTYPPADRGLSWTPLPAPKRPMHHARPSGSRSACTLKQLM